MNDPLTSIDDALSVIWLAGLLEGEGSFGLYGQSAQIAVAMTDRDVVQRVSELLGTSLNGPYTQANRNAKAVYKTQLARRDEVLEWCRVLRPYMSYRRQGQIDQILEWGGEDEEIVG